MKHWRPYLRKIHNKNYKYNMIYESDYYLECEHNIPINLLQDLAL